MEDRREEIRQARGGDVDAAVHKSHCPKEGMGEDLEQSLAGVSQVGMTGNLFRSLSTCLGFDFRRSRVVAGPASTDDDFLLHRSKDSPYFFRCARQ